MTVYGYDPARVTMLRDRTVDAVDELARLGCDDPAAAHAVRVTRLMRHNLETAWLPLLDAIHTSTAMVSWRREGGLVDDAIGRIVGRLVEQLGARSSWITTAGLDDLDDAALWDELDRSAGDLLDALDGRGDLGASWYRFERVLGDSARRLDPAGATPGADAWRQLGPAGFARVLEALERLGAAHRGGLLDTVTDQRGVAIDIDDVRRPAARLLGAILSGEPEALGAVLDRLAVRPELVRLVLEFPGHVDTSVVSAFARELLRYTAGVGDWAERPRVHDRAELTGALLVRLARTPSAALGLLADDALLVVAATTRSLDDSAVESLFASALGDGAGDDPVSLARRLEVLAGLVDVTATDAVTAGTARGVARSLGTLLPFVAIHLDRRLPVEVTVPDGHARDPHVVGLGSHDDVARMLGQVMDDRAAQLTLGVAIGAFRVDRLADAAGAVRSRSRPVAGSVSVVAAHLADVTRVVELLVTARAGRDELHLLRHGMATTRSRSVLSLLGSTVAWTLQPVLPMTSQLASFSTSAVNAAIARTVPRTVPDTGIEADLAIEFDASVVALPLLDPAVRTALGLHHVPPPTWERLGRLLDELAGTTDPGERSRVHSRLRRVVADDPDLDAYLDAIAAVSGEDRQG